MQADQPQPPSGKALMTAQAFYGEVIEPHRESLSGVLEGINRIMELLERYGDCPSVVDTITDSERGEVTRIGNILSKVTLRDHTFNVTRIALRLLKDTYHDPVGYIPVTIIAALGHDLGKIPELRGQGPYVKADHPPTSVSIVKEIFEKDKDAHWLKMVAKAIGEHHQSATDPLSELLKEADGRARQMEIEQAEKRASLSWEEWFDCRELLRRVGATINVTQTGSAFRAFSLDGSVYCDPTFLYETARAMAAERSVIDITLLQGYGQGQGPAEDRREPEEGGCAHVRTREKPIRPGDTRLRSSRESPRRCSSCRSRRDAFENRAEFEEIKKSSPPLIKGITPL